MKVWTRATGQATTFCGSCHRELVEGDPVMVITTTLSTRRFLRCDQCEGPAPPNLPAVIEMARTTKPMQPLVPVLTGATRMFDWRAKASADRTPGEDG